MSRSFGEDRIVCVCNSTYCDSPEQSTLNKGQFQLYTTTKDGERLQLFVNNFAKTANGTILTVDKNEKFQMIFGFGGAMTDAAALNIRSLSNSARHKLLEYVIGIVKIVVRQYLNVDRNFNVAIIYLFPPFSKVNDDITIYVAKQLLYVYHNPNYFCTTELVKSFIAPTFSFLIFSYYAFLFF